MRSLTTCELSPARSPTTSSGLKVTDMKQQFLFTMALCVVTIDVCFAGTGLLDAESQEILAVPPLSEGPPAAGKRVTVTPSEYAGTDVFHTLYLPADWEKDGRPLPVIFEYTGNYFPTSGSTGEVEGAGLGYGLSGGRFIWVSLPYISKDRTDNAVTWWGDAAATVAYAKLNVPRIIREYGADPKAVLLCGFSRGAIGVNYIGLHDDEVSRLWTGFITHDHFDGVREWRGTMWGAPLERYREAATERLQRVGDRPYLVSQNGSVRASEEFIRGAVPECDSFLFNAVNTRSILGEFPNRFAKHPHTDRWLFKPSADRTKVWRWINGATDDH